MKLNITNILYFSFRMIPFVLVSYFLIHAIFLQDFKSLIYLGGLLLACFVAVVSGNMMSLFNGVGKPSADSVCSSIPLFDDGPVSRLPLSTVVYIYSLCYFGIPIMHYKRELSNLPILIVFPLLAFFDMMWLYNFGCSSTWNILGAGAVGMFVGLFWSEMIFVTNLRQIQYFSILSHDELCKLPSDVKYQCTNQADRIKAEREDPNKKLQDLSGEELTPTILFKQWTAVGNTTEIKNVQTIMATMTKYEGLKEMVKALNESNTIGNYLFEPAKYLTMPGGKNLIHEWNQVSSDDAQNFTGAFQKFYALPTYTSFKTDLEYYASNYDVTVADPSKPTTDELHMQQMIRAVTMVEMVQAFLNP
jgi:hypothetical protein